MEPKIDILTGLGGDNAKAFGSVASMLLNSANETGAMNINALRTNDVLRKEEWLNYDKKVVQVARDNLVMTGELIKRGLVMPLANALGTTVLQWEKVSDMNSASITMNGLDRTQNEGLDYALESMPIPIVHKDFQLNMRHLLASRRNGDSLDTTQVAVCTRKVSDVIENLIFNGVQIKATNGTIWGLRTHPNRVTGSVTAAWATATGDQIIADVLRMITLAQAKNQYGPYLLVVNVATGTKLGNDYKANSDKTIAQRITEIDGISGVVSTSRIPAGEIILMQLSEDTVQMIDGLQPTVIQWESNGGFTLNFKVMAIMLPRVRADYLAQSGIVHFS